MPSLWHGLSVFWGVWLFSQILSAAMACRKHPWVLVLSGGFWYCFCCCVRLLMGVLFALQMDIGLFWGICHSGWENCHIHWRWVDCCLRLDKRWWWCWRFQLDPVPSDCGAMRGMNSVRPSIVFLHHFPIDPGFAVMTGWWFAMCITANFDWVVLCTCWLVILCFALMPFFKDVFFHDAKVNQGRCQETISGRQYIWF